ncbi:Alpha/Beta hydrolase protein [Aspergillus cavernicola]|uniref:Alpha/Beta hydrolase protein n=1 Tax=Aspergillus cavernicola TaxID=176166 RepID=A0ABR4IKD3_9EURO
MANRLSASIIAVLLALSAVYLQQPLNTFLNPPPTVVDLTQDITYIGSLHSATIEHFRNIFYAEEPTGYRRFAPPVPTKPPKGSVIDATKPGAWCPQGTGDILPFTSRVANISENCLSLRIARSKGTSRSDAAKLPVVVWIHGGGHALGSASDILYEPDGLVRQAAADGRPLIYVGINYRLGLFGFATSKAMIERKETNAGLRDQRAALEWVRNNIKAFGGDPNRVTVVGQSVGASDLGLQLMAFGGAQDVPFQQAMMMSGGPGLNFNSPPDQVASNTADIAQQLGCVKNGDDQGLQALECLREAPFELLTNLTVAASRAARPPFGEGYFYPTIDNDFIQARPSQLMRAGKFVKEIPLIASWVTNDGAWYAPLTTSTDEEVLGSFGLWLTSLSESTKEELLQLYPLEDFERMVRPEHDGPISPQYYRAAQMNRDIWFTCPVLDFTWQYVRNGGAKASQVRLYEYNETRYTPVFRAMGVPMWRVAHLSDIPYLFNNDHLEGGADNSDAHLSLAQRFSRAVIDYIHSEPLEGRNSGAGPWTPAFPEDVSQQGSLPSDVPSTISIQIFGGPHGSSSVTVRKEVEERDLTESEKAVYWEKLFSRCEFINGQQMRDEAGV